MKNEEFGDISESLFGNGQSGKHRPAISSAMRAGREFLRDSAKQYRRKNGEIHFKTMVPYAAYALLHAFAGKAQVNFTKAKELMHDWPQEAPLVKIENGEIVEGYEYLMAMVNLGPNSEETRPIRIYTDIRSTQMGVA